MGLDNSGEEDDSTPHPPAPAGHSSALVSHGERVYAPWGFDMPVGAIDPATGCTIKTYPETKGAEDIIVHDGLLLTVADAQVADQSLAGAIKRAGKKKSAATPRMAKCIIALPVESDGILWRIATPEPNALRMLTLAAGGQPHGEYRLDSPPVWDGMPLAQGCLYIRTIQGKLLRMKR